MASHFNLDTFKNCYSSLLEHICSNKDFLKSSNNVSNIWKTTDTIFIRLLGSFFSKQPEEVKHLIPSSKLFSTIVLFCEKNNDQAFLTWVKSFNNCFLYAVGHAMKKIKPLGYSSIDFDENLRVASEMYKNIEMRNKSLEKMVLELQKELKLSQEKNATLSSHLESMAEEEIENFRKRMRNGIYSFNVEQSTSTTV